MHTTFHTLHYPRMQVELRFAAAAFFKDGAILMKHQHLLTTRQLNISTEILRHIKTFTREVLLILTSGEWQ